MNWEPFLLADPGAHADPPRSLDTAEGIGDRLRAAAFAEIQAREAFRWACETFGDAPIELKQAWMRLADAEQKHLTWLLDRMTALGHDVHARRVSNQLWFSLISCKTAREFALYMASAEDRGRRAGLRFQESLRKTDPVTAEIFGKIADEESTHIALAAKFFS